MSPIRFGVVLLILLVLGRIAAGQQEDPDVPANPVLTLVEDDLRGDVTLLGSWSSPTALTVPDRWRLAELKGFLTVSSVVSESAASLSAESYSALMNELWSGAVGSIGMVDDVPGTDVASPLHEWEDVPMNRRLFLAFSGMDVEAAVRVRGAYENQGFRTFTYLAGHVDSAPISAEQTGYYFATAGTHLVLDSSNARKSIGVAIEARLFAQGVEGLSRTIWRLEQDHLRRGIRTLSATLKRVLDSTIDIPPALAKKNVNIDLVIAAIAEALARGIANSVYFPLDDLAWMSSAELLAVMRFADGLFEPDSQQHLRIRQIQEALQSPGQQIILPSEFDGATPAQRMVEGLKAAARSTRLPVYPYRSVHVVPLGHPTRQNMENAVRAHLPMACHELLDGLFLGPGKVLEPRVYRLPPFVGR